MAKKKKDTVWVVSGTSESGDHYTKVFKTEPTDEQLQELVDSWDPWECYDCEGDCTCPEEDRGPGFGGSYVHIDVEEEEVG